MSDELLYRHDVADAIYEKKKPDNWYSSPNIIRVMK
jgi:hypothetical protein